MVDDQKTKQQLSEELHDAKAQIKALEDSVKNLKQSEEKFSRVFESNAAAMSISAADTGRIIDVNNAMLKLLGYTREELIGKTSLELGFYDDPQKRELIKQAFLKSGSVRDLEINLRGKNGEIVCGLFSSDLIEVDGESCWLTVVQDVTARKKAEEEKLVLERQVQQAQKLESLGVLAGGIAHDFNNLLVGILGNAELALMHLPQKSPAREIIQNMVGVSTRAADLAKQMLAYSGKGMFVIEPLELESLVIEMTPLLKSLISKKAVVNFDFAKNVPAIEADATQMRQIIMNLVVNAAEAIGDESGIISVRTGIMDCDRLYLDETYLDNDLPEGIYSYLEVSDTGCGMDKEAVGKIFDPFYTTKFTGRGLGLAAVLGIVRGHKGAIKVYSEPDQGTIFKVLFPSVKNQLPTEERIPAEELYDGALEAKRVLLVDDEETVRTVARTILDVFKMEVVTANDGKHALELFEKEPDNFDCVLLDLTMPFLDGEETYREMRRIKKDVRVVLSSGYNQQDLISRFAGKGLAGFIQKPYGPTKLREALLDALSKKLV
jgi:PAS domain S-box-containing protein